MAPGEHDEGERNTTQAASFTPLIWSIGNAITATMIMVSDSQPSRMRGSRTLVPDACFPNPAFLVAASPSPRQARASLLSANQPRRPSHHTCSSVPYSSQRRSDFTGDRGPELHVAWQRKPVRMPRQQASLIAQAQTPSGLVPIGETAITPLFENTAFGMVDQSGGPEHCGAAKRLAMLRSVRITPAGASVDCPSIGVTSSPPRSIR